MNNFKTFDKKVQKNLIKRCIVNVIAEAFSPSMGLNGNISGMVLDYSSIIDDVETIKLINNILMSLEKATMLKGKN